ncbi:MAG TPA: MarR family transcriptional regulator, partial [Pseudonocardia sp.]
MTGAYRPGLDRLGLTYPQYLVMLVLWEHRSISVSELSERLQLSTGTLSPLLKRLENAGLLTRRRRTDDERLVQLTVTDTGLKLLYETVPVRAGMRKAVGMPDG